MDDVAELDDTTIENPAHSEEIVEEPQLHGSMARVWDATVNGNGLVDEPTSNVEQSNEAIVEQRKSTRTKSKTQFLQIDGNKKSYQAIEATDDIDSNNTEDEAEG